MKRPRHLKKEAYNKYDELEEIVRDRMSPGDENMLAVLANAYIDYQMASEVISDRGVVLAGETMTRKNPAFEIVKENVKIIDAYSSHFGLTPKSRKENMQVTKNEYDPLMELKNRAS